jgi:anaerobic selenocysteine-containing dehydrogenase
MTRFTPALVPLVAERRPAWWIFSKLSQRMGISVLPDGPNADTVSEEDLLAGFANRGRRSFEELQAARVLVDESATFGWVTDSLPDEHWRIAPDPLVAQLQELAEEAAPSARPLLLIPRRQPRHLNSLLRGVDVRGGLLEGPEILVHPDDAAAAGIADGDLGRLESDAGMLEARVRFDGGLRRGVVAVPHGWSGPAHIGRVISGSIGCDPLTGMVHQSGVPVSLSLPPDSKRPGIT